MIIFDHVTHIYQKSGQTALYDIDITIKKGECVCIVGPSGAGKTSFLKLLWGEIKPKEGIVYVNNKDIHNLPDELMLSYRKTLGSVFQDYRLLPTKTVFENVAFSLYVSGTQDESVAGDTEYALELVGLLDKGNRFPGELSAGEQQRLALARAFVRQPEILLADEPTGNLDPKNSEDIAKIFKKINELGTTIIIATHSPQLVDELRERVILISEGQIIHDREKSGFISV
jgi:cell division transport system ATP-binding protein